jgi:hypothetical protein
MLRTSGLGRNSGLAADAPAAAKLNVRTKITTAAAAAASATMSATKAAAEKKKKKKTSSSFRSSAGRATGRLFSSGRGNRASKLDAVAEAEQAEKA